MTELKRYTISGLYPHIYENKEGFMVYYEDYVRLKGELYEARRGYGEGMKVMLRLSDDLVVENARLKAEVERLRKAGDELSNALAAFHLIHRGKIDTTTQQDIVAWNAAKEGKPSV